MSDIHVRQIKSHLERTYQNLIDLSDCQDKTQADREARFLTRALAAFSVSYLADVSAEE